jgi:cysteinyl-tRNA synthetase
LGGDVLGIIPDQLDRGSDAGREDGLLRLLVELRAEARARKDWTTSDQIREKLSNLNVTLEDRLDGTVWKLE